MVKGISKRVVVIKQPVAGMFEEAIFIVRDDRDSKGVSKEDLLREAGRVASNYMRSKTDRLPRWLCNLLFMGY